MLLAYTALCAAAGATAAHAGPTGGQVAAGVANAPTISSSGGDTRVQLNQNRTIIDWKTFTVGRGEKVDFVFSDKSGIVLNRTGGAARVDGALNGCVVTCSVVGGNVWIYAPGGVIFGGGARVNVGSLLATSTPLLNESAFLNGGTDFTFGGAGAAGGRVQVQAGAQLAAHGGALAMIAPEVEIQAGSSVAARGTVLAAAAQNYRIRFDETAGGGFDLLDFQVPASALEDGSVSATPLAVNGAVTGGSVILAAVSRPSVVNAVVSIGGTVLATGVRAGEGGSIVLTGSGSAGSAVDVSGVLQAAGGRVDVTAPAVSLEGRIDVSAPTGGGTVRLGGGARGQDPTLADAQTLTVAPGAAILADATDRGSGGSVTLWSNTATDFRGAISARGGPHGGDGGSAEVSGATLRFAGLADLRAPLGTTGTLLLDPTLLAVVHTGGTGATSGSGSISITDIDTQLAMSDVTLSSETITFADGAGAYAFDFPAMATARAGAKLTFQLAGGGFFTFNALQPISAASGIGLTFDAGTGVLPLTTAVSTSGGGAIRLSGGAVTLSAPVTTDGGAISVSGSSLSLGAAVDAGSGAVALSTGSGDISQTGGAVTAGTLQASATGGAISLTRANAVGTLTALTTTGAGHDAAFTDGAMPLTVAAGAISTTGTATITTGGALTLAPGAVASAGALALTGAGVEVMGAFTLPSATTVTASTGSATFDGAVDGTQALAVSGPAVFKGAVGAMAHLASLTADAVTVGGPISAVGAIHTGALTLTGSTALLSDEGDVSIAGASAATGAGAANLGVSAVNGTFRSTGALTGFAGLGVSADTATFASGNQVGVLAANLRSGALTFDDAGSRLSVGAVGGLRGVSTAGKNISISSSALTVDSPVTATVTPAPTPPPTPTVTLASAGALALNAEVNAGSSGVVVLAASGGGVTQTAALTAGQLRVSSNGAITLTQNNALGALTGLDTTGGFAASVTSASPLTVSNAATAHGGALTLTSAGLTLDASSRLTGGSVSLFGGTGDLTQAQGGVITTASLTGSAAGAVSLASTANAISGVGAGGLASSGSGDVALRSGVGLVANGQISAQGGMVTVSAAGLTLAGVTASGDVVLTSTGASNALVLTREVRATSPATITLGSDGALSEAGAGTLTADNLVLTSGGGATLAGANRIGTLVSAQSRGPLTFSNAQSLTVLTDSLSPGGMLDLSTTSGDLTLRSATNPATVLTTTYDVSLTAMQGAVDASAAPLSTAALTVAGRTVTMGAVSTSGAVSLTATGGALTFTGALDSSANVTLVAVGLLTTAGETLSGDDTTYSVKASSFDTQGPNGGSLALSPTFTGTGQNFLVEQTAGSLDLSNIGTTSVGGQLSLTADAGAVTATPAATLTVGSFTAQGTAVTVGNITTNTGGATLTSNSGGVAVNGPLTVWAQDQSVVISATGGDVTQSAPIIGPTLSVTTDDARAITLTDPGNTVSTLAKFTAGTTGQFTDASPSLLVQTASAGGDLTLLNSGDLMLGGAVSAIGRTLTIGSSRGAVSEMGAAALNADTLAVSAATGVALGLNGNTATTVSLLNTGTGDIIFKDSAIAPVTLTRAITSPGDITVTTAGALHLAGPVTAGAATGSQSATLDAGGLLDQDAAGTITAGKLSAQGGSGVDLSAAANAVSQLVLLQDTTPGDTAGVKFTDTLLTPLTITGVQAAGGDVVLSNPGGLTLTGALTAVGREVTLTAASGPIVQQAAGATPPAIVAGGVKLTGASITLDAAGNAVGRIDSLAASSGASFVDNAPSLTVAATNSGSGPLSLANTGGALMLVGAGPAAVSGGPVTFTASGLVSQAPGATLQAPSLNVTGSGVALAEANVVPVLTKLIASGATAGSFRTTGGLQVLSATAGGAPLALTAGSGLSIAGGTGISGRLVTLTAGGAVTQDAAGKVSAATLTGHAGSDFDLGVAQNAVARLQAVSVGGKLALQDTQALTLAGAVGGATVVLLDPSAPITQEAGSTLSAGVLTTTTSGGLLLTGANSIGTAQSLVNTGGVGITLNNASTGLLTVAKADAGGGDLQITTGGALSMTGPLTAGSASGAQVAKFTTGGAVTQAQGGSLTAGVLTGVVGDLRLDQPGNAIGRIGDLRSGAGALLVDTAGLELTGALAAGGAVALTAPQLTLDAPASLTAGSAMLTTTGGGVALLGTYTVSGASVIASAGPVSQGPGPVTSGVFGATAVGGIVLPVLATPQISQLVNTGSGDIVVTLATPATTSGLVGNAAGAVTLVNTGALAFTDAVNAGTTLTLTAPGGLSGVSASAGGAATLTGAGVAFTGAVSAGGDLLVQAGTGAATFGSLAGGNDVTITAGPVSVAGSVTVGRDYVLTGTDFSDGALAPSFGAGGRDFLLTDTAGGLTFKSLHAPRNLVVLATDPAAGFGAISGGALTADTGQVSVTGASLVLSGPVLARGAGAVLTAKAGGISLGDAVDVGVQTAVLTATGPVVQTGANGVTAGVLQVSAGGGIVLGAANHAPQATLVNTGGGGVLFNDLTPAATVVTAVTAGGDIVLTAPQGTLTLGSDLDAPGALRVVAGGSLSGGLFAARGGGAVIQAGGDVTGRALTASGAATLAAANATFDTVSAGGDLTATLGGALRVSRADVGGAAQIRAPTASLDTLNVARDLAVTTDGAFNVGAATAGGSATLQNGSASLGTLAVSGDLTANASGPFAASAVSAGGGASVAASQLTFGSLRAGRDLSLVSAGALTLDSATVGGGGKLDVGSASVGSVAIGGDLSARAAGALAGGTLAVGGSAQVAAASASLDTLSVGRNLALSAPGAVRLGGVAGRATGTLSIAGGEVLIGAPAGAQPGASNVLDVDPTGVVNLVSSGALRVAVTGPARLASAHAGGALDVLAVNGDAAVADAVANGALSVASQGGSASLGRLVFTGAGPLSVAATEDVLLGAGAGVAGADTTLSAPAGLLTASAGRDLLGAYAGDLALGGASAGRTLALTAGGLLSAPSLKAGGDARLTGAAVRVASVTAGGGLSARALTGDAVIDAASAGGDLSLSADAGAASLRDITATATAAGPRTLTLVAARDAVVGRSSATGATGRLALSDPGRTAVTVRSTGSSGGVARVDVQGDARLAQVASASGDVLVAATGAVTGAPTGSDLFTAAKGLSVSAGGDATLGGASTAGGAASVTAGGMLSLVSLAADTVRLRASDLALTGALQARAACSGGCAAPTLAIESASGPLTLGAAPAGTTFASGGMTIDSAELGRVKGADVALYAGSTADAARRGDLQVGDMSVNGGDIGVLRLLAGPANTVRVAGAVTPAAANAGALVVGGANAADGWTPRSVYVTGALGQGSATATAGAAGFGSVELNAVRDVLIGSPVFVAAVTAAEPADGGAATGAINITRGLPTGVQATAAELNREIVTAGTLTLRADGYVVSQNTGATGQQAGLLISNPNHAATVLTLGRTGAAMGSRTPNLIDLSLSLVSAGGTVISRQIAASSPAVDLTDLSRSDAYRINGCSIGAATSCTPLPNTIVDIRINKLVEGVQLATEDPPPVDDPTITGAGNEEIWRSPSACSPDTGEPCR